MKHVITGSGQIGTELARRLLARGDEVVVLRRSSEAVPGVRIVRGDVLDAALVRGALAGADAVHHCIHAAYDSAVWRRELPPRERVVMDAAAEAGIPVVFPESVYAFGDQARHLREGAAPAPTTPLGRVRADLLAARAAHSARTLSVVASDLFGPTAGAGSVATVAILRPVLAGRRAWVPARLDVPHSWTYLPDLADAMVHAAVHAGRLAPAGDRLLHAPTAPPRTCAEFAQDTADAAGAGRARVSGVPPWPLAALAPLSATAREMHAQRHLWRVPAELANGALVGEEGLRVTPWDEAVGASVGALLVER